MTYSVSFCFLQENNVWSRQKREEAGKHVQDPGVTVFSEFHYRVWAFSFLGWPHGILTLSGHLLLMVNYNLKMGPAMGESYTFSARERNLPRLLSF